jgi:hypothetical protein
MQLVPKGSEVQLGMPQYAGDGGPKLLLKSADVAFFAVFRLL